ncbi:BolA family transcriptional regulator [Pigmentiphaga aceris]|uniref:BolA family transcriptional regulator n=1 Tax=Pigmentiphaga aceris TaxID=1940612 RepID=A0A5C0AWW3_9BURK|nr:BolA family protein [Pigmentiphaga aceris]QEI06818.1 BolA family transcriptional regulator [Pigmentiphaga aceris]
MSTNRTTIIEERLAALLPTSLRIDDESHLHAGHAGAAGGAGHYRVHIVAACFKGLRLIARHRLVYDQVQDLMPHEVHALSIHALAPDEVAAVTPA